MPTIFLQTLYINIFGKWIASTTRKMIVVVNGNNTFKSGI